MFLNLKRVPNTTRLAFKSRLARAYQRSLWCEWQMSGVSCATVVVIRSKCKAQRWWMSSSCLNTKSFHSVPWIVFLLFLSFLTVQTPSFRVSRDGIARPEQTKPIRLSRLGLDKLIGIKVDKGGGAAPSDTSELCRCIRPKNSLGRRLERVKRMNLWCLVAAVDRLGRTVRSSIPYLFVHLRIPTPRCWNIG